MAKQAVRAEGAPDIEEIMARIRAEVKRDLAALPPYEVPQRLAAEMGKSSVSPLLYSEELNFLNANWHNWRPKTEVTSHRRFLGPFIVRVKKFLVQVVWHSILRDYFDQERAFLMNLVRHLNSTARYIDTRDGEIFWQLIRKIDNDTAGGEERLSKLFDQMDSTLRTIELGLARRIGDLGGSFEVLQKDVGRVRGDMGRLDSCVRGFERAVALLTPEEQISSSGARAAAPKRGAEYLLLENRFRGSEEEILERVRDYRTLFTGAEGPVLDLGCGRGEFLEVLRDAGIEGVGIDLNEAMVARCRAKGLHVQGGDALEFLRTSPDRSLGGVFAAQVVEHLTREELLELLSLVRRKVVPGGRAVFETINPQSYTALARNFFRDPTHVWPLHPDTLSFMLEMAGIRTEQVMMRSPYPPEATFQPFEISSYLPGRWQILLQQWNDNVTRLNDLLFGHQDYCVVGMVDG